jgi:hypothetical protein
LAEALIDDVDEARERQERRCTAQESLARERARLANSELELVAWSVEWRALITAARLPETIDPAGWAVRRDLVTDLPTSTTARLAAHSH